MIFVQSTPKLTEKKREIQPHPNINQHLDATLSVLLITNEFYCRCYLLINTWQTDELQI